MRRIKQFADKAFVRPDRTEVLSEGLQEAEKRIDQIKLTCESISKKVQACLQGQGKDGVAIEKRIRKVPEFVLGSTMVVTGKQHDEHSVLGEALNASGEIEMKLGQAVVEFEIKIEECVLKPLQLILDHDLPNIYKLKRTLSKLTETMDQAKAKLTQASRHSTSAGTAGKMDNIKEDLEDAQLKVEQCRDNLAAEMYALLARESEISRLLVNFLNYQKEYHKSIYDILNELVPGVVSAISQSAHKPVYGVDMADHLTTTKRKIAYPLELCICGLLETGLDEEGLFRIAGSASKVKKLKSAFDAGILDLDGLLREFGDPHVMANALKCYLRELPVPLLTSDLYDEWMNAIRINGQEKLQALWTVVKKLPKYNLDNLTYLVKFLKELCKHQDVNKMSAANIAIVIGPNLLWSTAKQEDTTGDTNPMGLNMTMTHHYSSVVDQLVSYCDYFFPEDIDFFVTCVKPVEPDLNQSGNRSSVILSNGLSGTPATIEEANESDSNMKRSQSSSSVDEHSPPHGSPKPVLRRKNKPAPVPPTQTSKTSPTPQRNNSVEKEHGAQLTKTNSFNNRNSQHIMDGSAMRMSPTIEKEKREGIWIPPSPSQLANRKLNLSSDSGTRPPSMAPPKPPQPQFDASRNRFSNVPIQPNEPPTKPSMLKYKTSFKASNSIENPSSGESSSPGRHNTTDNIDNSSNNAFTNTNQFSSLPRHFHTDNSYKNQRAPRPPSIFNVPPAVPPPQPPTAPVSLPPVAGTVTPIVEPPVEDRRNSGIQIGFEKLEHEIRKSSSDKSGEDSSEEVFKINSEIANNNNNKSTPLLSPVPNPPVPAPRSSLTQGGSPPTVGKEKDSQAPTAKERPSIMAKPRDLPQRTQSQNKGVIITALSANVPHQDLSSGSGGESDNQDNCSHASQSVVDEGSAGFQEESGELCRNGGLKSLQPLSPTSKVPYRPPRPQPPPPPKIRPSQGESTDL